MSLGGVTRLDLFELICNMLMTSSPKFVGYVIQGNEN